VLWRAVLGELPEDLPTMAAALAVIALTFGALQLTEWRPRSGWVWLPGGGGGAALGLACLAIAPRAVVPSGMAFWCAVSASELFTLTEQPANLVVVDPLTGAPFRAFARWLPCRLLSALAGVLWLGAVMRVLLSTPPVLPTAWTGSKALYALELQLLLASWWACGTIERERGAARPSVLCRALLVGFRTLLHLALAARVLSQLLLPADAPLATWSVAAAASVAFGSLIVALTCTRGTRGTSRGGGGGGGGSVAGAAASGVAPGSGAAHSVEPVALQAATRAGVPTKGMWQLWKLTCARKGAPPSDSAKRTKASAL
jgi:hypothetical protein